MLNITPIEVQDGYRLDRLELYNWGTFNGKIWTVSPTQQSSLLTGANGSGKSTVVDALLTLLVPNRKRNYNQASGDRRGERGEKTYVLGAYGRLREAGMRDGQMQYLRDKKQRTVILAAFKSTQSKPEYVTLAQVLTYTEAGLNKFFVVARMNLSIAEHFALPGTMSVLRRHLRDVGANIYDSFTDYSADFRRLFHMHSEKALDLFNQTVSIKEIGSLNQFIRDHMLEKTNAAEHIQRLQDNFQNLSTAHAAIVKAEHQQQLLYPIIEAGQKYQHLSVQIDEARQSQDRLPLYFAWCRIDLLARAIQHARVELGEYQSELVGIEQNYQHLDQQRIDLRVALQQDQTGQLLQRLEETLKQLYEERDRRWKTVQRYLEMASELGLPDISDAGAFHLNRQTAGERYTDVERRIVELKTQRDKWIVQLSKLMPKIKELKAEITSLEQRRTKIPLTNLQLRERILTALKIDETALPFVGELVRVREEDQAWEGAIERVLHSFGLTLLVPETHYRKLSRYVNERHLGSRLTYRRVQGTDKRFNSSRLSENALFYKLEVRTGTPFTEWLRDELGRNFDYVCCGTLEAFHHERRALTLTGQIKHDLVRHEKNDSFNIDDRSRYILGWNNEAKLNQLRADLAEQEQQARQAHKHITQADTEDVQLRHLLDTLKDFLRIDDFNHLDWPAIAREIEMQEAQRSELEESSDQLRQLKESEANVTARLKEAAATRDRLRLLVDQRQGDIDRYQREQRAAQNTVDRAPLDEWEPERLTIERELERLQTEPQTLETLRGAEDRLRQYFLNRATTLSGNREKLGESLATKIEAFRYEYKVDTESIGTGVAALPDLQAFLQRLERDDLPKHRARFKEMLDKKVIDNISDFQFSLERQKDAYAEVIDQLNQSLGAIEYETSAYIRLQAEPNPDAEIVEFRNQLRACLDDALSGTPEANETAFQRIQHLIQRFEKEERWTKKVSDVRNWLNFAAVELWRDDNTQKRYHSDSSGMSGGQKAKLAYTILASAVAYQYGTSQPDRTSATFRFVVIDEAFSKVDDNNARYAMELFGQLGLQLLVVTPLDKIHIVEPYVGAYHYVFNTDEGDDSRVLNLTVEEFRQQQAQWNKRAASLNTFGQ